jgi:hypothetical protein
MGRGGFETRPYEYASALEQKDMIVWAFGGVTQAVFY